MPSPFSLSLSLFPIDHGFTPTALDFLPTTSRMSQLAKASQASRLPGTSSRLPAAIPEFPLAAPRSGDAPSLPWASQLGTECQALSRTLGSFALAPASSQPLDFLVPAPQHKADTDFIVPAFQYRAELFVLLPNSSSGSSNPSRSSSTATTALLLVAPPNSAAPPNSGSWLSTSLWLPADKPMSAQPVLTGLSSMARSCRLHSQQPILDGLFQPGFFPDNLMMASRAPDFSPDSIPTLRMSRLQHPRLPRLCSQLLGF